MLQEGQSKERKMKYNNYISVAIDGPSGAGKSTQAKRIAEAFGFIYADTGAIYRSLGLACHRQNVNCMDESAVMDVLRDISIELKYNAEGEQRMYLSGEDVSAEIRLPEISICASDVSAHAKVREFLLKMQRDIADRNNVVMDGRDIGTVVLPEADIKIFLTASAEARAKRRLLELQAKGIESDFESVLEDMKYRDAQDSSRAAAPLKPAEDAVIVDTTDLDFEASFEVLFELITGVIKENS